MSLRVILVNFNNKITVFYGILYINTYTECSLCTTHSFVIEKWNIGS